MNPTTRRKRALLRNSRRGYNPLEFRSHLSATDVFKVRQTRLPFDRRALWAEMVKLNDAPVKRTAR